MTISTESLFLEENTDNLFIVSTITNSYDMMISDETVENLRCNREVIIEIINSRNLTYIGEL